MIYMYSIRKAFEVRPNVLCQPVLTRGRDQIWVKGLATRKECGTLLTSHIQPTSFCQCQRYRNAVEAHNEADFFNSSGMRPVSLGYSTSFCVRYTVGKAGMCRLVHPKWIP
jgi:hypothetical protein